MQSAYDRSNLTPKQWKALGIVVGGGSLAEAAEAAGCSSRTLRRWAAKPAWQRELDEVRRVAFDSAVSALQTTAHEAVRALLRVLRDPDSPPSATVAASRAILEFGYKLDPQRRDSEREEDSGWLVNLSRSREFNAGADRIMADIEAAQRARGGERHERDNAVSRAVSGGA